MAKKRSSDRPWISLFHPLSKWCFWVFFDIGFFEDFEIECCNNRPYGNVGEGSNLLLTLIPKYDSQGPCPDRFE